jgi:hypothetical protein
MYRHERNPGLLSKRSAQLFVITLAMTSAASLPASAAQTSDASPMPPNAAIAGLNQTAVAVADSLVARARPSIPGVAVEQRSWSELLADHMASPVHSELYEAGWISRSRRNAHRPAGEVAEGELTMHQALAPTLFLRVSLGVAYEPRLTGASSGHAAVGLSLVRPFD